MSQRKPFFFLHGAPGDIMCGLGNALAHPRFESPGNFLFYGNDPSVAAFIDAQEFVGQVLHVPPTNEAEYRHSIMELCVRPNEDRSQMLWQIARRAGVSQPNGDRIITVHVGHRCKMIENTPHHWKSRSLPKECYDWAEKILKKDGYPNILINPYSFQSNTADRHWKHWPRFLDWLEPKQKGFNSYVVGLGWDKAKRRPGERVNWLVNQTPSNNHVLALAALCDGIITTSNNLSHWAVIADIPVINVINAAVTDPNWYFRKWYNFPKAKFVELHDPYIKLIQTVESWEPLNSGTDYLSYG